MHLYLVYGISFVPLEIFSFPGVIHYNYNDNPGALYYNNPFYCISPGAGVLRPLHIQPKRVDMKYLVNALSRGLNPD